MIAYHGTRSSVSDTIRSYGLEPSGHFGDAVFLSADRECAEHFAHLAADDTGEEPVVVVVGLPDDALTRLLPMGPWQAVEHAGSIPAAWIVAIEGA